MEQHILAAGNYERVVLIHLPSSLLVTSNPPVMSMANVGGSFRSPWPSADRSPWRSAGPDAEQLTRPKSVA
jgi:hypothetical protein